MAQLVVTAVKLEGRTKAEVTRDYGVSRQWVHKARPTLRAESEAGLEPHSRRPRGSPARTPEAAEDQIVKLRKHLADQVALRKGHTTDEDGATRVRLMGDGGSGTRVSPAPPPAPS